VHGARVAVLILDISALAGEGEDDGITHQHCMTFFHYIEQISPRKSSHSPSVFTTTYLVLHVFSTLLEMSYSRPGSASRFSSKGAFDALTVEDVPSDDEEPVMVEGEAQPVGCALFCLTFSRLC
jgi:hypothetical protein